MSRMDRYNEEENSPSRLEKNQELYRNFSNNTIYTNVTDITTSNTYEIHPQDLTSQKTREAYQQIQKYQDPDTIPKEKKELEEFNHFYPKKENKVYDINSVLEAARRNREEKDDQEEKRKLKNDYNILSGINKQELEKYREEKRKRMMTPEEEEIRELIDTIASKTLAGEIDKATSINLLSDLMATSVMDKVNGMNEEEKVQEEEKEEPVKEEKDEEEEEENTDSLKTEEIEKIKDTTPQEKEENKDEEFYTRSMDLSDKDLNISDDFKEESLPLAVKILIFLVIFAVIALAIFFIYQKIS